MATRSAGGDDQLFERQERALDRLEMAGEDDVVFQMFLDGLGDGLRLLVDFAPHGVGMLLVRWVRLVVRRRHWDCG